jgi:hypothetical protein
MGLDQILYRKTYVKNWGHTPHKEKYFVDTTRGGMKSHINPRRVSYVQEELISWRKAYHIDEWFQGLFDCYENGKEHPISESELKEFLETVNTVLANHSLAKELLPTSRESFDGDEAYDEWYFQALEEAKEVLEDEFSEEFDEGNEPYYCYYSSW